MQLPAGRLYGLDWLRIGAFALLILYHIGMYFVEWDWHVKAARPQEWLELPMMALNPWRLLLLFLISGVASRILLRKLGGAGAFARGRSARLLIPLLAGVILFVPPQPWAELSEKAGYADGYLHFWMNDYFRFGDTAGVILPTYNHLWFVVYLWLYTMALALLATLPASARARLQDLFDRLFSGWGLLVLPILYLAATRIFLHPLFPETHAIVDDPYTHAVYAAAFFFGVAAAGSEGILKGVGARWKAAALLGAAAYAAIVVMDVSIAGDSGEIELLARQIARSIQAWGVTVGLLGFALVHLHRDGPVRRYLTDAIFPWYIAHQSIIVLAGHALKPQGLAPSAEFAIILAATAVACFAFYEGGRRISWVRPLIGLALVRRISGTPVAEEGGAAAPRAG